MKALCAMAAVGLGLMGAVGPVSAQYYGGPDVGPRGRDYGYGDRRPDYEERGSGYDDRGSRYGERGSRYQGREAGFDEREYLRCNPDVRRAVNNGQVTSALAHYQRFGRREGRRLSC